MEHVPRPQAGGRGIDTIPTLAGIFAGIGVLLSATRSVSQIRILESPGHRVPLARLAVTALRLRTALIQTRWHRLLQRIAMLFALLVVMGYVAMI